MFMKSGRLLVTFAFVVLGAGAAAADQVVQAPILEPYAPFKLVGLMPDTQQVLLWSEVDAEYRLAKLGDDLGGWRLSGIDPRAQRASLQKEDLIDELELVRLPRPGAVIVFRDTGTRDKDKDRDKDARPLASSIAPTVIEARPPEVAPPEPAARQAPPAPPPPAAPPAPPPVIEERHTVARADLDREINDFDRLMTTIRVGKADGGGFTIVRLDPKSWVAGLGFQQGDVVRSLAGEQVSTIEDAARVYARLRALDAFDAEIERGPQRVVLKFEVK